MTSETSKPDSQSHQPLSVGAAIVIGAVLIVGGYIADHEYERYQDRQAVHAVVDQMNLIPHQQCTFDSTYRASNPALCASVGVSQ
jgi:hypothetical protein